MIDLYPLLVAYVAVVVLVAGAAMLHEFLEYLNSLRAYNSLLESKESDRPLRERLQLGFPLRLYCERPNKRMEMEDALLPLRAAARLLGNPPDLR